MTLSYNKEADDELLSLIRKLRGLGANVTLTSSQGEGYWPDQRRVAQVSWTTHSKTGVVL